MAPAVLSSWAYVPVSMCNRVASQSAPGFARILFLLWCVVAPMVCAGATSGAPTQSVTLAWDANTEPDIAGYRVYYGTVSRQYSQSLDAGNTTTASISGLASGTTYFFAATALDTAGLESDYSNEVQYTTPLSNTPPTAGDDTINRGPGESVKVAVSALLANDTDATADPLSITDVSTMSAKGAVVSLSSGWVFYQPPADMNEDDSFTYTVSDGRGGTATGAVTVSVTSDPNEAGAMGQLGVLITADGKVTVGFVVIPGRTYAVLRAGSVTHPIWETIGTAVAGSTGLLEFVDENPPPVAGFYRAMDLMNP